MSRVWTETWLKSLVKKPPERRRRDYTEKGRKGLMLRHHPGGALTFIVRYHRGSEQVPVTLGNYPAVSLEQAHEEHAKIRRQIAAGLDPADEREREIRERQMASERRRVDNAVTVRNVIAEWAWHYARRNRKRPREAVRLLRVNLQTWASKPVRDLVKRDAVLLLDRITARGSLVMANRIRDLGNQCFNFGIERDLIELNPFAGIRKPGGEEKHKERNLSADEIRAVWIALDSANIKMSRTVRLALKLILISAQRPGEVIGAAWSEFGDLDSKNPVWRIPAERSKNGKPHVVPMSDFAVEILTELRKLTKDRPRRHIAPSVHSNLKADEPLSERALSRALRNNHDDEGNLFGLEPFTPHDLRRSAATGMTSLGIARLHVAKVLNHSDRDITAIYDRHDYLPEKRAALQTWADHLRSIVARKHHKVMPIAKELRA
jgi:integrase